MGRLPATWRRCATAKPAATDDQKQLDFVTHQIVIQALKQSPVAWMGSEEDEEPMQLNAGAPLAVNADPLDGSSNIDTNVSIGTIFSILPAEGADRLCFSRAATSLRQATSFTGRKPRSC